MACSCEGRPSEIENEVITKKTPRYLIKNFLNKLTPIIFELNVHIYICLDMGRGERNPSILLGYRVCHFIEGENAWVRNCCPRFSLCLIRTWDIYLSGLQALGI